MVSKGPDGEEEEEDSDSEDEADGPGKSRHAKQRRVLKARCAVHPGARTHARRTHPPAHLSSESFC